MRRADLTVLTPHERDELASLLNTLVQVKAAIHAFEAGEVSLHNTARQMALEMTAGRTLS
ncbi:MAG: hypothetical protein WCQ77_10810 [Planctomycetota bacterium]